MNAILNLLVFLFSKFEDLGIILTMFFLAPLGGLVHVWSKYLPAISVSPFLFLSVAIGLGAVTWFVVARELVHKLMGTENRTQKEKRSRYEELFSTPSVNGYALLLFVVIIYLVGATSIFIGYFLIYQLNTEFLGMVFLMLINLPLLMFISLFVFGFSAFVAPFFWIGFLLKIYFKTYSSQIMSVTVFLYIFCCLGVFTSIVTSYLADAYLHPAHHLNAMVKNTCIIDPQRMNCPKKVEDIRIIEPESFDKVEKKGQILYSYDEEKNEYLLLVRLEKRKAILFSQKLKPITAEHGREGIDFKVYDIFTFGKDRISDLPEFAKDFEQLPEWEYKRN